MSLRTAKDPRRGKFGRSQFYRDREDARYRRRMANMDTWRWRYDWPYVWPTPVPWKTNRRIHRRRG